MPDQPIYIPILKAKEGELAALEELRPDVRSLLTPLIELPPIPFDFAAEQPLKTLKEYIDGVPLRLKRAGHSIYLDTAALGQDDVLPDGRTALETLLVASADHNVAVGPVLSRRSSAACLAVAARHFAETGIQCCVRLKVKDFNEDVDIEAEMTRLLEGIGQPDGESIDLIIDLEDLGQDPPRAVLVARSLFSMIPRKNEWRRMILTAASFPEDLSKVSAATTQTLPRHEWDLWKTLKKRPGLLPRPDLLFGDYAMTSPTIKDLDPRIMRMSANIRYTTDDEWLVIKGRNVGQHGFGQYFDLCSELVDRPEYKGRNFSWGDWYIYECSLREQGPGNATTWRKVGVNHHLTLMAEALSNPNL